MSLNVFTQLSISARICTQYVRIDAYPVRTALRVLCRQNRERSEVQVRVKVKLNCHVSFARVGAKRRLVKLWRTHDVAEVIKTTVIKTRTRKYVYVGIASMFNEMEEENDAVQ